MKNLTRQSKSDHWDAIAQSQLRFEQLSPDEQIREKLAQLLEFIRQLATTTHGQAELQHRERRFGACVQAAEEGPHAFYGRLRRWLDRDLQGTPRSTTVDS